MSGSILGKWRTVLDPYYLPLLGVVGATVASVFVLQYRKTGDPQQLSNDRRDTPDLPNTVTAPTDTQGFGRDTAVATGTMEGDRAFQGIFPAKKAVELMAPVLPAKQADHPGQEKEPEKIKSTAPKTYSP